MKKTFLLVICIAFLNIKSFSQKTTFGVTAGFLHINAKADIENNEIKETKSGAYAGVAVEFWFSEKFHLQPQLLYATYKDYGVLMMPIVGKYYPIERLNIQFGPQIDYSTKEYPNNFEPFISNDDLTRFGISLATGLGYLINDHFFVESRYTFQLNDVYTGDLNISLKGHIFNAGLGYRF